MSECQNLTQTLDETGDNQIQAEDDDLEGILAAKRNLHNSQVRSRGIMVDKAS